MRGECAEALPLAALYKPSSRSPGKCPDSQDGVQKFSHPRWRLLALPTERDDGLPLCRPRAVNSDNILLSSRNTFTHLRPLATMVQLDHVTRREPPADRYPACCQFCVLRNEP